MNRWNPMNCLDSLARRAGRDYVTPEDVTRAMRKHPIAKVRRDLLEFLSMNSCEDPTLCAHLAHRGKNRNL